MERLKLEDFDFMGLFTMREIIGVEDLVTPIESADEYLSRNHDYYKQKTCTEQSEKRENLKRRLGTSLDKRNFVILENMLNCSARVYYEEFIRKVQKPFEENHIEQAKKCMEEDTLNIVKFFNGQPYLVPKSILPCNEYLTTDRTIEMDNKALLYIYSKAFKFC